MSVATILIPLPDHDFDVTEVAVPWKLAREAGHRVVFATETGATPACDPLLLSGVIFGQLGAEPEPKAFYSELSQTQAFLRPPAWTDLAAERFDGLLLPGGHAPGMRQYLASESLQSLVAEFFAADKPVGAICHGVVLAARSKTALGRSVLYGRKTTCLPGYMERVAYFLTAWKLGTYYRTYPTYVEDEICAALADPADFQRGPLHLISKGTRANDRAAFVVEDGNYVSARWPGDAYLFAKRFLARLDP
jgi:putative intracellular protease/amidase